MSVNLDFQCSRVSPSKVVGPGGAVQYFPRPYGPSIRSGLASTPNSADATGALLVPANPSTDGQQLHVQASGTFGYDGGDPSGTVTVALYAVTGSLTGRVSYT